jgi:predicted membrane protein
MKTKNYYRNHLRNKLIFGGLVIAVGIVLFGLNFGCIPQTLKPILFSWQMLIILLGIVELFCTRFFKGIILLLVGGFFLIPNFYRAFPEYCTWASEDFVQIYWPLLLIAGGIILIVYWLLPEKYKRNHHWHHWHHFRGDRRHQWYYSYDYSHDNNGCKSDYRDNGKGEKRMNKNVIFASCDEIYLDEVFNGGEINVVFGNVELDLRRTTLPEGETHLEINDVFGSVELCLPSTWNIEIHLDNVGASSNDSRHINSGNIDKTRKLVITGSVVFGCCEIKD